MKNYKENIMKSTRKQGVAIGILFLLAMVVYMVGSELTESALNSDRLFADMNVNQLRLGILLEFVNSVAVVGILALLFPILRKHSEWAAFAYAASRIIEAVLLMICSVCALLISSLSAESVMTLGSALLGYRNLLFQMSMISLGAGSILFCGVLYASKLVPRILSGLGVIGYIALFISGWLGLFGYSDVSTLLFVPGAIFEITFPIWLFVKGFAAREVMSPARSVE
jgi:tetrahydromethanopterin S-methyltransferase subunit F